MINKAHITELQKVFGDDQLGGGRVVNDHEASIESRVEPRMDANGRE